MTAKQLQLQEFARDHPDLSALTEAEREVYEAVEVTGWGVRAYAVHTDRAPGTVGNLLAQAREKIRGGEA